MQKKFSELSDEEKAIKAKKFWARVDIRSEQECWPWMGPRGKQGYGHLWFCGLGMLASRVAYTITHGDIGRINGRRVNVCHRCDNPPCCNPAHLFAGTHFDNLLDAQKKGRHRGKVTPDDVREIRRIATTPTGIKACSALFGINPVAVKWIVQRKSWKWVE